MSTTHPLLIQIDAALARLEAIEQAYRQERFANPYKLPPSYTHAWWEECAAWWMYRIYLESEGEG